MASISTTSCFKRKSRETPTRRCQTNPYLSSLRSTKRAQKLMANKFRIRNLPECTHEDTKGIVISALSPWLDFNLLSSDIISCEQVERWDFAGGSRDIVVTFKDVSIRDRVMKRIIDYEKQLPFKVCDELSAERAMVYASACHALGDKNVIIYKGVISIFLFSSYRYCIRIRTLLQFRAVMRRLAEEMKLNFQLTNTYIEERPFSSETSITSSEDFSLIQHQIKCTRTDKSPFQKKLRLRKIPELPNEDVKRVAIESIQSILSVELEPSDVESCKRVIAWDGYSMPRDIVVTFKETDFPLNAYFRQQMIQHARSIILDELSDDMVGAYKFAIKEYGEENVYTLSNRVVIEIGDHDYVLSQYDL